MDLFGRISGFLEVAGPLGLGVVLLVLLALLVLAVMNQRRVLLGTYLVLLMFSGFSVQTVDAGATLLRWVVMFLLALTCIRGGHWPGWPALLLGLSAATGLVLAPLAPMPLWAVQVGGLLLLLCLPMASSVATTLETLVDIERLLKLFLVASALYVLLGLSSLGSLTQGQRFSGASSSAPLFVMTGGVLLPIAVWGAMNPALRRWRLYCLGVAACTFMLCIISGERTGTFAGIIASLPLLGRIGPKRILVSLLVVVLAAAVLWVVLQQMPDQAEFVRRRFISTDTTGRGEKWAEAFALCLEEPWIGHGLGGAGTNFGFHNAYLVTWYDGGAIGLLLYVSALGGLTAMSFLSVLRTRDPDLNGIARLVFGLALGTMAAAFFESKLTSPSNIAIFTTVMCSVILSQLRRMEAWHRQWVEAQWQEPAGDRDDAMTEEPPMGPAGSIEVAG